MKFKLRIIYNIVQLMMIHTTMAGHKTLSTAPGTLLWRLLPPKLVSLLNPRKSSRFTNELQAGTESEMLLRRPLNTKVYDQFHALLLGRVRCFEWDGVKLNSGWWLGESNTLCAMDSESWTMS